MAKVRPLRVPVASPHRPCTFSQSFRLSCFLLLKWKGGKIHQYHLHHRHEGPSKATEASWICPCRGGSHHMEHPVVSLCHPFKPLGWDAEACQALRAPASAENEMDRQLESSTYSLDRTKSFATKRVPGFDPSRERTLLGQQYRNKPFEPP